MTAGHFTAQAVADLVGGRLLGDGRVPVRAVATLERAGPDALSLAISARYADALRASRAGTVLVPQGLAQDPGPGRARIVVAAPYRCLVRVVEQLFPQPAPAPGVDPTARVGPGGWLGAVVSIGTLARLGRPVRQGDRVRGAESVSLGDGVSIGDDSVLGPRVVCYPGARIGSRVVLKAGAVIGGDGFGYLSTGAGHDRIPHIGGCILEDDVEVGSNSCVDRGSLDDTIVGRGTKLDNLVHVAHNVRIGERCLLMAGVGVAAKSAVFGDVEAGAVISGHPARANRQFLRAQAALYRLTPLLTRLERLAEPLDE